MNGARVYWAAALAFSGSLLLAQGSIVDIGSATSSAAVIPFAEAIAKAEANQPLVLKAQAAVQAARAKVGQEESGYFPKLSAQAGYDWSSVKQEIELGSDSVELTPKNAYDFEIDAGFLVYDFGKRELRVKLARNGVDSAILGVDRIKQDIAYRTARSYYGLVFLKAEARELEDEIAALNEHLASARKKEEEGSTTHIDAVSAQLRLSRTDNRRADALDSLAKQKIVLRQLMGLAFDQDFDVDGDFPQLPAARDSQSMVAFALANRPEMRAALKAENAAQLDRSIAELGGRPSIGLHGEAGYKNGLLDSANQNASSLVFNWSFGMLLTMPLFDGFRSARANDEAAAMTEMAHQESEERRRTVTTQVLEALQDLSSSGERITNAKAQVEAAKEYLGMSKIQYDLGAGTGGDYLEALDAFTAARLEELDSRRREALGGLSLRQAIGDAF